MFKWQGIILKIFKTNIFLLSSFFLLNSVFAGDIEAGKAAYAQKGCAACHGESGISAIPTYPNLAGQNEAYIIDSITQYQNKARNNPIMSPMAAIVNEQEIKDIAAYLSSLK